MQDYKVKGGCSRRWELAFTAHRTYKNASRSPVKTLINLHQITRETRYGSEPHDLSVDIWAVGLLALQLLSGFQVIPGIEQLEIRSQITITKHLDMTISDLRQVRPLPKNAESFIHNCLKFDQGQRPTATEALNHPWFREPQDDDKLLEQLVLEAEKSWAPRGLRFPAIKALKEKEPIAPPTAPTGTPNRHQISSINGILLGPERTPDCFKSHHFVGAS